MNLTLVLNRNAGTLRGRDPDEVLRALVEILRAHGHTVKPEIHSGQDAVAAILRICAAKSCDAVVVGGGDGTVSAAAAAAAKSGVALGILPLGTMNLFARSLGMPLDLTGAAEALATSRMEKVDIGVVNGRTFIHHVTLGLHPRLIRVRERLHYASRLGKLRGSIQAWWIVLRHPPRVAVRMTIDGRSVERRTAAILITNNPLGEGHLPYADDLRQGALGVYVATSRRWGDLLQLTARMILGGVYATPLLENWTAREVEIRLRTNSVSASVDGEITPLESPLRCSVREGGLTVLRPGGTGQP